MNFYYVRLSCPKEDDDGHFEGILDSCLSKSIKIFTLSNIPNHLDKLNKDDLVLVMLGGDVANKRRFLKDQENSNFTNGIYAIAKTISVTPATKEFTAEFYPLNKCLTREQIYFFPQFIDNLGGITMGSANQAGLYELAQDTYLSLIDYLTLNNLIDLNYSFLSLFDYKNCLKTIAKENEIFKAFEKSPNLNVITDIFSFKEKNIYDNRSAEEFLIQSFCNWYKKPENYNKSYEGLFTVYYLQFINLHFFGGQLFSFNPSDLDAEKIRVEKLISNTLNDEKWVKFNLSTSKGSPKAIVGKNNYLKFLDAFFKDQYLFDNYKKLFSVFPSFQFDDYSFLSKPFIILAGISGTGKTKFIRDQAEKTGSLNNTYQLVPVRPDWHEPSDLIGYISRLNGKPKYIVTDVLKFIVKAWQAIFNSSLTLEGNSVKGNIDLLSTITPFWLCLDEMNLAPVEQYFSDYLSVLETRRWAYQGNQFEYSCDSLIPHTLLLEMGDDLRTDLGLTDRSMDTLWNYFFNQGIGLPFNLIVAGTVNMDETTHGFSRKVLDRALTFDFGEFFPNEFDNFFTPEYRNVPLCFPIWSDGRNLDFLNKTFDKDGLKTISFLKSINNVLEGSPFKLAYRALNEILLSVIALKPKSDIELQSVWDDFIMCKVLPRIEGDFDKLVTNIDSEEHSNFLKELEKVLIIHLVLIWTEDNRKDFYRVLDSNHKSGSEESIDNSILIPCRSKKKIHWMAQRLSNVGFTSFWP